MTQVIDYGCVHRNFIAMCDWVTEVLNIYGNLTLTVLDAFKSIALLDEEAMKVVYLAIHQASKKWSMPIRNWKAALNRFMIEFEDRLMDYV